MDSLQAERDQNVTIDTAQIWFSTARREYVLIDAPGHKEFIKNMVTGAARADAAVIVIDVSEGVREQTRRHGCLLRLIGVRNVIVVVNKMDLVAYRPEPFRQVEDEYRAFLTEVGLHAVCFIPVSARHGDNVAMRSDAFAWYDGDCVLEAFDAMPDPIDPGAQPLRFPLQDVYRFDHRRILAGRIESGTLSVGDPLLFLPTGRTSVVHSIERWNTPPRQSASVGEPLGVTLIDQLFVERGEVACHPSDVPALTTEIRARLFWLGRTPMVAGRRYKLRLTTQEVECEIAAIDDVVDASTLQAVLGATAVQQNDVATVLIRTRRPVAVDRFERVTSMGRFVLVEGYDISGGGIVTEISANPASALGVASAHLTPNLSQISSHERIQRNGHRGAVVWLTGLSGSGKSTLANALERKLFERGLQVFVLDGDNIRYGLSADLGFSHEDRAENVRRVAEAAKLFAESGLVCITAFISPYRSDRLRARTIMKEGALTIPFLEVYLNTPLEVCEGRDPKQLYRRARAGEIREFTGVSSPYEAPDQPELVLNTATTSVLECVDNMLDWLIPLIR